MRRFWWLLLVSGSFLAACGGGSGSNGGATLGGAALEGLVVEVDGQTVDRSGVAVEVVETGATTVTGVDGTFAFPSVPAGTVTLRFRNATLRTAFQRGDDDGETETEDETESEDDDGNPRIDGVDDGDRVRVRVALDGDTITEFSLEDDGRRRARNRLRPTASAPLGAEASAKVEQRPDREKFEAEVDHVAPGATFDFFLDDPSDAAGFAFIGSATASAEGEAELEFNTKDGQALPMGAATAADLAGFLVEARATGGTVLFTGEVPDLPSPTSGGIGDAPGVDDRARGKARLTPAVAGLEGSVEIERRPERGEQEFELEAENLAPGTIVRFFVEDPENAGSFELVGERAAGDDGEAELEIEDGAPLPFGATDVADLVGLEVEVRDSLGNLLLSGTIPALVAD